MISHGSQKITDLRRGTWRITSMTRGTFDILGLFSWLSNATRQAIMDAFLDDGMAVIQATIAYLNQLAASDRDKATALAGFINEDPMMVCSLGLQPQGVTMPIRWLVGDGNSWVKTGYYANVNSEFRTRFKNVNYPAYIYGTNEDSSRAITLYRGSASNSHNQRFGSQGVTIGAANFNGCKTSKQNKDGLWLEDTKVITYSSQGSFTSPEIYVFTASMSGGTAAKEILSGDLIGLETLESGVQVQNLVPFVSQTRNGMVDLVAGVFHPNEGTGAFTAQLTEADGVTPWTTSTP